MSASIVRKALELVDPDFKTQGSKKKHKKEVFSLVPDNQRLVTKIYRKGNKETIGLQIEKKYSVEEARKTFKSKDQILKANLKKLELIKKHSTIQLDRESTKNIIERAITRRPIKNKKKKSKTKQTAFTEEDFKKFEEEYFQD